MLVLVEEVVPRVRDENGREAGQLLRRGQSVDPQRTHGGRSLFFEFHAQP